jgi:hypothetical protein
MHDVIDKADAWYRVEATYRRFADSSGASRTEVITTIDGRLSSRCVFPFHSDRLTLLICTGLTLEIADIAVAAQEPMPP